MARLIDPVRGTVVRCEGDLAAHLVSLGWTDADAAVEPVEATPEKPVAPRRTSRKPRS